MGNIIRTMLTAAICVLAVSACTMNGNPNMQANRPNTTQANGGGGGGGGGAGGY